MRPRQRSVTACLFVAIALIGVGCGSSSTSSSSTNPAALACGPGAPAPGPPSAMLPPSFSEYWQPAAQPQPLVVAIDGGYGDWSRCEVRERAALGAAVTRHEWQLEEPVDAQDALVLKAATEAHTRLHALLGGNELGDPQAYTEFVVAFIRRYGLGGSFWHDHPEIDEGRYAITSVELGNEPYFGGMSATEYAATVAPAMEAVKALGVPIHVILVSAVDADEETGWVETLYQQIPDLNSLFFGFAIHPYTFGLPVAGEEPGSVFRQIEVLRRAMNASGAATKPIWITEYGESTSACGAECSTESTQAEYLQQVIAGAADHPEWNVGMVMVFQLIDRGTDTSDRELGFGILRQNGSPKPSYAIVEAAAAHYRGS